MKQLNASVPVPRVRLVAYQRISLKARCHVTCELAAGVSSLWGAVQAGGSTQIKLHIEPKYHSIVPWGRSCTAVGMGSLSLHCVA